MRQKTYVLLRNVSASVDLTLSVVFFVLFASDFGIIDLRVMGLRKGVYHYIIRSGIYIYDFNYIMI